MKQKRSTQSEISLQQGRWGATEKQRKNYLDKSALIGEINHKNMQSLHAGDKCFEFSLRDRWKDELKPASFVYQIREGEQFSKSRVISRLRSKDFTS